MSTVQALISRTPDTHTSARLCCTALPISSGNDLKLETVCLISALLPILPVSFRIAWGWTGC